MRDLTLMEGIGLFLVVLVLCYAANVLIFGGGDPKKGGGDLSDGGWG